MSSNGNTESSCLEKQLYGNCSKGENCKECNYISDEKDITKEIDSLNLNTEAKVWIPKSRQNNEQTNKTTNNESNEEPKITLNLEAKEFVPKLVEQNKDDEDDEDDGEEIDMIMNDIIDNEVMEEMEEEESDEERWVPKYRDCECCKGFVYKCSGTACVNMGACYCKMQEECDDEEAFY
jgi:hypothetical protein